MDRCLSRTDVWSRNFLIWEINFGLWALAWAGPWEKGVWAYSEQLFWVVFSIFHGQKKKKIENIVASELKSCIEKRLKNIFLGGRISFFGKTVFLVLKIRL